MAARPHCRGPGGHWRKSQFSDVFGAGGEFCRGGGVRGRAFSHRRADYFFRGLSGHAGWASGTTAASRYGVRRVLRFDAGPLRGHGAIHGLAGVLLSERADAVRGGGGGGYGGVGDGELRAGAGGIADSAVQGGIHGTAGAAGGAGYWGSVL